jgi:hypothetical protein
MERARLENGIAELESEWMAAQEALDEALKAQIIE